MHESQPYSTENENFSFNHNNNDTEVPPVNIERSTELDLNLLEQKLKEILPPKDFGVLYETVTATTAFQEELKLALKEGRADRFLQEQSAHLETVYPVLDQSENANNLALVHRGENLQKIFQQLSELTQEVLTSPQIDDLNKDLYLNTIDEYLDYCRNVAPNIGKPEFSQAQPENWQNIIDLEASKAAGKIVFPEHYVNEAAKVLQAPVEKETADFQTILQTTYNFSETEKAKLGAEFFAADSLNAKQFLDLMQVLCERAGITGWESAVKSGAGISINEVGKQICAGEKLTMGVDRIKYSPPHEMTHLICAEHGVRLNNLPLQKGAVGYLDTQEGITMVTEMVMGKKSDDPKNKTTAMSYLVRQLLSDVKQNEHGEWQPTHSVQEVYKRLIEMGADEKSLGANIYRALRGTSLTRTVVDIQIDENGPPLKMAETYLKDMVYWRGQQQMYEYLLGQIDFVDPVRKEKLTARGYDFNQRLLQRIGYEKSKQSNQNILNTSEQRAAILAKLATLGQETIFDLIDELTTGRAPLETLLDPRMRALTEKLKNEDQFVSIQDIFQPKS